MIRLISIATLIFFSLTTKGQQIIDGSTKDSIRTVICKMLSDDQKYRTMNEVGKQQKELDSINFYKLMAITKKFGYPDKNRIGENDCDVNPFLILLHNPERLNEKENYDVFMSEYKKGNISGWELGQALDRYYVHYYKKSLYGIYGRDKPCIEDIEIVNKNRRELGLKELKEDRFKTCR